MFSHVMVGSNDLERSRKFYDALFGKEEEFDYTSSTQPSTPAPSPAPTETADAAS